MSFIHKGPFLYFHKPENPGDFSFGIFFFGIVGAAILYFLNSKGKVGPDFLDYSMGVLDSGALPGSPYIGFSIGALSFVAVKIVWGLLSIPHELLEEDELEKEAQEKEMRFFGRRLPSSEDLKKNRFKIRK